MLPPPPVAAATVSHRCLPFHARGLCFSQTSDLTSLPSPHNMQEQGSGSLEQGGLVARFPDAFRALPLVAGAAGIAGVVANRVASGVRTCLPARAGCPVPACLFSFICCVSCCVSRRCTDCRAPSPPLPPTCWLTLCHTLAAFTCTGGAGGDRQLITVTRRCGSYRRVGGPGAHRCAGAALGGRVPARAEPWLMCIPAVVASLPAVQRVQRSIACVALTAVQARGGS